jgi:anaphase-promoting complex subunit 4
MLTYEKGHKRWDHAMSHGLTKVFELTHENLLPALDRCVAIVSHLRGLAIYHEHSPVFNVPSTTFDAILNIIRCMRLLAHHLLLFCSEETQQFTTFSKWLRREIDIQASETPSNPAEEAEQDLNIDYSLLLSYIQGALEMSKLDPFVKLEHDLPTIAASSSMYDDMKNALESFKSGEDTSEELINLSAYFDEWVRHNKTLVDQATSHQRASSSITSGLMLEEGEVLASDIRMIFENEKEEGVERTEDSVSTWTAIVHKETPRQGTICITRR